MKMIQVKVKPRAKKSLFTQVGDGSYLASIKSPPVDGKANAELISLISRYFGCSRAAVRIKSGKSSRQKLVQLENRPGIS
jgi:uncharacterized protein